MPAASTAKQFQALLREIALGYPEAHEDFPWGERVIKVRGKVFVFLGRDGEDMGLGVKLPSSAELALALPFVERAGYGLGKSGWVNARFSPGDKPPIEMLREWIDESYRAVAPKKLIASLPAAGAAAAPIATAKSTTKKSPSGDKSGRPRRGQRN